MSTTTSLPFRHPRFTQPHSSMLSSATTLVGCSGPGSPVVSSAPSSGASTPSLRRPHSPQNLDLSSLPPPTLRPPPPQKTNTVLLTNLRNPSVFETDSQAQIRRQIETIAPVHTWVPLKSFQRVLVLFETVDQAVAVRATLDGLDMCGETVRIFFGPCITEAHFNGPQHLALPDAGKLFFISPPPSPPHGWEMKLEDAPNKMVHADDLAKALEDLHHNRAMNWATRDLDMDPQDGDVAVSAAPQSQPQGSAAERKSGRTRSSTLIYHPEHHGSATDLPTISVEQHDGELAEDDHSPLEGRTIPAHTARPPVELME